MSGMKKNNRKSEDLLRYAAGEMSDRERNSFEKEMQRDQFAADAAEGLSMLDPSDAASDLSLLRKRINVRSARRNILFYSGIAAVALVFIVTSVVLLRPAGKLSPPHPAVAEERTQKGDEKPGGEEKIAATSDDTARPRADSLKLTAVTKPVAADASKERSEIISVSVVADREVAVKETLLKAAGVVQPLIIDPFVATIQMNVEEAGKITGMVTDETGKPFPFVNIYIKGQPAAGTVTGADGRFTLTVPDKPDTSIIMVANFVGYKQLLVQADKSEMVSIRMEPDMKALDEVIVVGYGERRKTPVTAVVRSAEQEQAAEGLMLAGELSEIVLPDSMMSPDYTPPLPVGGYPAFHDYIRRNIRNPKYEEGMQVVIVEALLPVSLRGRKGTPVIVGSNGEPYSAETVRLLSRGPGWSPAMRSGTAVNDTVRIRITFLPAK